MKIRCLKTSEIDCRAQSVKQDGSGCSLLLYKNARCDMKILDEVVGPLNWQRKHTRNNANCIVSIWDEKKEQWIEKEDTGTESNVDKEKGLASDSFKRACINWGIGIELYTAPFIWIRLQEKDTKKQGNGKIGVSTRFHVESIESDENKNIIYLKICDQHGKTRFETGKKHNATEEKNIKTVVEEKKKGIGEWKKLSGTSATNLSEKQIKRLYAIARGAGFDADDIKKHIKAKFGILHIHNLSKKQYDMMCEGYEKVQK